MALQRTHIRYGDVDLVNCLTDRFTQEPVFDDSGTDLLYFKYTISVTSYVHGDVGRGIGAEPGVGKRQGGPQSDQPPVILNNGPAVIPGAGDPGADYQTDAGYGTGPDGPFVAPNGQQAAVWTYRALRKQLGQERQQFQMWIGDNQILRSTPAWGETEVNNRSDKILTQNDFIKQHDLNNGPKVLGLDITKVQGPHIFRVQWTVEICQRQCPTGASAVAKDEFGIPTQNRVDSTNHILSNRWSVVDDIDQDLMTTRTYTGVLRAATASVNPNVFRPYAIPTLGLGMKLHSMSFQVSPDGLTLDYQIVHKEITHSAPYPATSWDFKWSITTGDGMISTADATVRLKGNRQTPHGMLIQLGLQLLESRLHWSAPLGLQGDKDDVNNIIDHLSITDRYGDSGSDVSLSCAVKLVDAARQEIQFAKGGMPIPLPHQAAFDKMGLPISAADMDGMFGAQTTQYDKDYSLGSRKGAWIGASSIAGGYVAGTDGAPISGALPLQQAFSCAMRDVCIDSKGDLSLNKGKWWINDASGSSEATSYESRNTAARSDGVGGSGGPGEKELEYPIVHMVTGIKAGGSDRQVGYDPDHTESMYTRHWSDSHYYTPDNAIPIPIAGALGGVGAFMSSQIPIIGGVANYATNRLIRLTQPNTQWVCRIIVERVGRRPQLPKLLKHFEDNSTPPITYSLVNVSHNWQSPVIGADLSHAVFRCDCEFTYSLSRPIEHENDHIRQPDIPWLQQVGSKSVVEMRTTHKVSDSFTRQANHNNDTGI